MEVIGREGRREKGKGGNRREREERGGEGRSEEGKDGERRGREVRRG